MRKPLTFLLLTVIVTTTTLISAKSSQAIVTEQWAIRQAGFHGPDETRGLGLDSSGNIYVAGEVSRPRFATDYELVKYSPEGVRLWRVFFPSPGEGIDSPEDLVVSADGNAYMTGAASQGGGNSDEYATVKYNSQGQMEWSAWYNGPAIYDHAMALALDQEGNVYVTGWSQTSTTPFQYDCATVKYNSQGIEQWVARYGGPAHRGDYGMDVAVDGQGNVYVTGWSDANSTGATNYDIVTIQYNAQGEQQWVARFAGPNAADDYPIALALDAEGNAYICGNSAIYWVSPNHIITVKYDMNGIQQWAASYIDPAARNALAEAMTLDVANNVIITGRFDIPNQTWINTVKYSSNGALLWARSYQEPGTTQDLGNGLAVDADQNVYVTGSVHYEYSATQCLTLKYDLLGNLQWKARHVVDSLADDALTRGTKIVVSDRGEVIVAGEIVMGGGVWDADLHALKYNQPPGDFTATMIPTVTPILIPAQGGSFSYTLLSVNGVMDSLAVDYWWQAIYPTSTTSQFVCGPLQAILPLDSTLTQRQQRVPGNAPAGIYWYILNAGEYPGIIWTADTILVVKIATGDGPLIGDWANTGEQPQAAFLPSGLTMTVAPNPFNPSTVASYKLQVASHISLNVYDTAGRLVATLVEGWREAGEHSVTFDGSKLASGVYLAKINAVDFAAVQKLVLLK
jgi:hypothetical protein